MIPSRLAALVIRLRWVFIVVFTALTAFFAWQIPKAEFDTEMKNQLPQDLPTRVNLAKIEELFGGTDMAMIVLSTDDILRSATLERLQKLSAKLERMEEFQRVVSLFTASIQGWKGHAVQANTFRLRQGLEGKFFKLDLLLTD